jgi:hypothetical protein
MFLWAKELNAKIINKEIIPVYGGKYDFHLFGPLRNHLDGRRFADDEVETEVQNFLSQQSKDFYAGFDALVKRWDKCISVDGGYVEK